VHADLLERGLDLVEAVRLDDRGDELHSWLLTFCAEGREEWESYAADETGPSWPRTP